MVRPRWPDHRSSGPWLEPWTPDPNRERLCSAETGTQPSKDKALLSLKPESQIEGWRRGCSRWHTGVRAGRGWSRRLEGVGRRGPGRCQGRGCGWGDFGRVDGLQEAQDAGHPHRCQLPVAQTCLQTVIAPMPIQDLRHSHRLAQRQAQRDVVHAFTIDRSATPAPASSSPYPTHPPTTWRGACAQCLKAEPCKP